MKHGWGRFPKISCNADHKAGTDVGNIAAILNSSDCLIPAGNYRSYGDSALGDAVLDMRSHNLFLGFDDEIGVLTTQAGVFLADIIEVMVPRGWFPKVVPGTKLITVGGAIASDVHGKNHHIDGCFSEGLLSFTLMLADGELRTCSRDQNRDLFHATCGGMGLTGVILDATIQLKPIRSQSIQQTTFKTGNLTETFEIFEANRLAPYSVAWIDCLAKGKSMGRSLFSSGDFLADDDLGYEPKKVTNVPFNFPTFALNKLSMKMFNFLYYNRFFKRVTHQKVNLDAFFFPLDTLKNWNRIYGKAGFVQYQFIIPLENSRAGVEESLDKIADSGLSSFLAVLKLYGPENSNYLSFPLEGYSLAVDFKVSPRLDDLLTELDAIITKHGGRLYLAKDARMPKTMMERGYERLPSFREVRCQYKLDKKFMSVQSKRLGL